VTGDDWSRLGAKAERFAHFIGHRAYMKMEHGHCAALLVQILPSGERVYWCRLYQQRPQICRDLGRGSPECEAERALKSAKAGCGC